MKKIFLTLGVFLLPVLAWAASSLNAVEDTIGSAGKIIDMIIPILTALAVVYFIWGVIKFFLSTEPETKGDGKKMMLWGLLGLFVIFSLWGVLAFIGDRVGITSGTDTSRFTTPDVNDLNNGRRR